MPPVTHGTCVICTVGCACQCGRTQKTERAHAHDDAVEEQECVPIARLHTLKNVQHQHVLGQLFGLTALHVRRVHLRMV